MISCKDPVCLIKNKYLLFVLDSAQTKGSPSSHHPWECHQLISWQSIVFWHVHCKKKKQERLTYHWELYICLQVLNRRWELVGHNSSNVVSANITALFKQAHQFHTRHSLFPQRSEEKVVTFQLELLIDCELKEHLITTRIHNCNLQVQQWLQARKSISKLSSQTQVAQMSVQQDFEKEMKSALSPRCH
jgi:hypothetical protein